MNSLRKWFYRPRRDDPSLMAQFYFADDELNMVATELDSFDGRKDPERCTALVNQLRQCQDKVLCICMEMMNEEILDERANRDFRVKFPDDVMQENLSGQLWFGAECLAAGSSIMNREAESSRMRPLAKAVTKTIETVRNLLREQCLKPVPEYTEKIRESLKIFDRLFSEFELSYVSAMVPVKSVEEHESQQRVVVLFSETVQRALRLGLTTQSQVDDYDPALMFAIPRLAIIAGLLIFPDGPLNMDRETRNLSELFRPFRTLLCKIRELLWTMSSNELAALEKALCSLDEPMGSTMMETEGGDGSPPKASYGVVGFTSEFVSRFYANYPSCRTLTPELSSWYVAGKKAERTERKRDRSVKGHSGSARSRARQERQNERFLARLNAVEERPRAKRRGKRLSHRDRTAQPSTSSIAVGLGAAAGESGSERDDSTRRSAECVDESHTKVEKSGRSLKKVALIKTIQCSCGELNEQDLNEETSVQLVTSLAKIESQNTSESSVTFLSDSFVSNLSAVSNKYDGDASGEMESLLLDESLTDSSVNNCHDLSSTDVNMLDTYPTTCAAASPVAPPSSGSTSPCHSGTEDDEEVALALQAAEVAATWKVRARFTDSQDLIHRLFVCISGVADQLQTNYAADLRKILKCVFLMHQSPPEEDIQKGDEEEGDSGSSSPTPSYGAPDDNISSNDSEHLSVESAEDALITVGTPDSYSYALLSPPLPMGVSMSPLLTPPISSHGLPSPSSSPRVPPSVAVPATVFNDHALLQFSEPTLTSEFHNYPQVVYPETSYFMYADNFGGRPEPSSQGPSPVPTYGSSPAPYDDPPSGSEPLSSSTPIPSPCPPSERGEGRRRPMGVEPPSWVPDHQAPRCMACGASFTMVRRRHHCRNCGKVFCGHCSQHSVPLPHFGIWKAVRVCNICFLYYVTFNSEAPPTSC